MAATKRTPSLPVGTEKEDEDVELLDILSSSDSEDETTPEVQVALPIAVAGVIEDADAKFEREFEEEIEQVTEASEQPIGGDLKATVGMLKFINSFFQANYQDILPLVIDGRKFLIDGDSLLMLALDSKGLCSDAGGTTLHVIYIVEKFLSTFHDKGLNFVLVFFKVWDQCWSHFPAYHVARSALKLHLMHNQDKITVLSMESLWSEEFTSFIQQQRPGFLMTFTSLPDFLQESLKTTDKKEPFLWLQYVLYSQAVCCEFFCIDVVDVGSVHSTAICLMATVHVHMNRYMGIKADVLQKIADIDEIMPAIEDKEELTITSQQSIRASALTIAVASILKENSNPDVVTVMKVMLLYATLIEHTPLKRRCFQKLPELPEQVSAILFKFQRELAKVVNALSNGEEKSLTFGSVGDLWHGRFFQAVFKSVCQLGGIKSSDLGNIIANDYEQLVGHVNKLLEVQLVPYPIDHICQEACASAIIEEVSSTHVQLSKTVPYKLIPTSCKLTAMFTENLVSNERFSSITSAQEDAVQECFHEGRHWHNKQPMTDEIERIPDSAANNDPKWEVKKRYAQNHRNNMARFFTIYGLSLEGRSAVKAIVTSDGKTNQNQKKNSNKQKPDKPKAKLSKKDQIIEDNVKRKSEEKKKQIKERLKNFSSNFLILMQKGDCSAAVDRCEIELKRASEFHEFVLEILFLKAKASFGMWSEECHRRQHNRNLTGAKELFLVIREIVTISDKSNLPLSSKQKASVAAWLYDLGFNEVAAIWKFAEPSKIAKDKYGVGMSHVEFQLAQIGADLNRETGGKPDPRADGFIPDPWQVELFDIIDKNQSAVVVAPTSSGKTYASYYCMEKVIRESDDGVVVYVCPTKALVNQVHATIYARFKKNLPAGKVLQGVFTRDYRDNVMNCQILTTVPECMELLLLSPRGHTWAKRIKYVIFDEVHCLAGQSGGLAWENSIMLVRCPFLALSATIHKPESFCSWLQNVEDFKRVQAEKFGLVGRPFNSYKVSLVVHSERHNHLKKNIMLDDGTIQHVHPYSFLDPTTIEECNGIPQHISLSPDEALELYHAMKEVLPSVEESSLRPEEYFKDLCPTGFLSMQSVKKFSEELRITLEKEPLETLVKVLRLLQKVDYEMCQTGDEFVFRNIPMVMNTLRSRGMLPSLVFTYNRRLVEALPVKLLRYLRDIDDFTEDEETDIESESDTDAAGKKEGNKGSRRYRTKRYKRKLGVLRGPSMLKSPGSVRGEGFTDEKVIEFIEHRLIKMGYKAQDVFPSLLRRGLGNHFGGMNNRERSAVEMLFRLKILNFVSATGTLALGIHMPCKTVVVAGDSPYLNSLEFNQMSGRAGRRGFDKEGNVVLFGLNKRKMQTLITGNLPKMVGNFPLCASLILRLLLLVSDATFESTVTEEATNEALARSFTLLEKSLLYESQPGLKEKMKFYFSFVNQFLIRQGLVSKEGRPHIDAQLITHLHYHEPGNFAFYFLLRNGVLDEMCKFDKNGALTPESLTNLLIVLNFLFARLPLSKHLLGRKRTNSLVILPPLPEVAKKALSLYNREVLQIFSHYFMCITTDINEKFGEEKNLPFSELNVQPTNVSQTDTQDEGILMSTLESKCVYNHVCSVFAGLSGNTDKDLLPLSGDILHVRDDINVKIVPTIELNHQCNSYAYDFFKHGVKEAICLDNGLKSGDDFSLLKDFMLTLKSIHTSLSEMLSPDAKLLQAMLEISTSFEKNFNNAYLNVRGL